jgi:hypothetical protein
MAQLNSFDIPDSNEITLVDFYSFPMKKSMGICKHYFIRISCDPKFDQKPSYFYEVHPGHRHFVKKPKKYLLEKIEQRKYFCKTCFRNFIEKYYKDSQQFHLLLNNCELINGFYIQTLCLWGLAISIFILPQDFYIIYIILILILVFIYYTFVSNQFSINKCCKKAVF